MSKCFCFAGFRREGNLTAARLSGQIDNLRDGKGTSAPRGLSAPTGETEFVPEAAQLQAVAARVAPPQLESDGEDSCKGDGEAETLWHAVFAELGPDGLPSVGSVGHSTSDCKACCFFPKGRCLYGHECKFCHYSHEKRKRTKRTSAGSQDPQSPNGAWEQQRQQQSLQPQQQKQLQQHSSVGVPPYSGFEAAAAAAQHAASGAGGLPLLTTGPPPTAGIPLAVGNRPLPPPSPSAPPPNFLREGRLAQQEPPPPPVLAPRLLATAPVSAAAGAAAVHSVPAVPLVPRGSDGAVASVADGVAAQASARQGPPSPSLAPTPEDQQQLPMWPPITPNVVWPMNPWGTAPLGQQGWPAYGGVPQGYQPGAVPRTPLELSAVLSGGDSAAAGLPWALPPQVPSVTPRQLDGAERNSPRSVLLTLCGAWGALNGDKDRAWDGALASDVPSSGGAANALEAFSHSRSHMLNFRKVVKGKHCPRALKSLRVIAKK
mmetsp:Transcript_73330/g.203457  ORF Transcript_73330/g.203457 Transcript_73330/m.203457 type:complete len:488 (-) Transcript_73330:152-1615(-)